MHGDLGGEGRAFLNLRLCRMLGVQPSTPSSADHASDDELSLGRGGEFTVEGSSGNGIEGVPTLTYADVDAVVTENADFWKERTGFSRSSRCNLRRILRGSD